MKKLFALSFVVLSVVSLSSCSKNYTCTCKDSGGAATSITYHTTKSKAKTTCSSLAASNGQSCSIQ